MGDFTKELERAPRYLGDTYIGMIPAGKYLLSIQADRIAYCEPRDILELCCYTEWEVGIFVPGTEEIPRAWVDPELFFKEYPELKEFSGPSTKHDTVLGYVPTDVLQLIVDAMRAEVAPVEQAEQA